MVTASSSVTLEYDIGFDKLIAEIERLVRSGVQPDRISVSQDAAMQWACSAHWAYYDRPDDTSVPRRVDAQFALLRLLLQKGGDPNRRKNRNSTPLAVCCAEFPSHAEHRALERLALVLAAGGDPRKTKDPALCIALGLGAMRGEIFSMPFRDDAPAGHAETVLQAIDLLLQAGADIEAMDHREMFNPVLMAASMGSVPLLRFLKDRGANVQFTTPAGTNALMHCAGDVEGLDQSRAGISVAWRREGDPVAATRQLLEWGLDPAAANARGRTPLRLAVSAGNLDVAVVLAEALAARGQLLAADVRLFRGTPQHDAVAALGSSAPSQKAGKPKPASDGAAQRATWARATGLIDGPTDWQPRQYPQWLRDCLKAVVEQLACGADPRVPPGLLYLEYDGHFRSLRLSRTKSYLSRSGAVELEAQVADWKKMTVRFAQLDGDDWVRREEIDFPMEPGVPPATDRLCDAIGQLCARYFSAKA
ncbi:ankyrin repeat domain-containing protein [Acidovorax sp.]|uniref:ankyrin repeat domain-containing protein n=1 Tax=Acidovorax sp. TaxID=1872122 RepID=UPI003919A365